MGNSYKLKLFKNANDKNRLKMIYHRNVTMNAAQNRNFGLSKINYSITDYVGFFDVDDIMHPQRIGILYHALNGNKDDIDFLFHSFVMQKNCKDTNIAHDYLKDFRALNDGFMDQSQLQRLNDPISDRNAY